ncbi:longitudinals lacking protein, isoforms J/P/Q/S/Z [Contarinia nasturtii]|uniref:longitudinals lacking protein, isoforms J/P/Q/S/Z n=1 Tax=Contarinia nasturtii TaxID=265458 RepID=UPI0012D3CC19|nr:longitudinals lacking protein, isoforms J/P/Q/S/Z [Contarinia nasturtii]XP_031616921.1 longitudinals lacking protein, isoforms J/P/Q/S/Z [Contarinia nasturtii]XP_031616931.1 longitudinals lacking protein, isoforms J/P/Q/S/Z [Contarinia nasturtii]
MTGISQQFCVRWNSHLGSLGAAFPQLLAGQQFVDVTLACDGHQVHCHRLVLAACSSYFESLLSENPCKHPIIILPKEIKLWEIHALVDFMYKGQVNVSQAGLPQLLKCAETLQIRGLCGTESSLNEVANGKIDRDPNILSNSNNCSSNFNFTSMFASNLLNANYSNADDEQQFRQQQQPQQQQQHSDLQRCSTFPTIDNAKSINHRSNEILVKGKTPKNTQTDKITKEHCNAAPIAVAKSSSLKRLSDNEASNTGSSEMNIKCEEVDSDANAIDDGIDDDIDEHSNSKQSEYAMQQDAIVVDDNELHVICDDSKETTVDDTSSHNNIDAGGSNSSAQIHDIFTNDMDSISITKTDSIDEVNMCYSPGWSLQGGGGGDNDDELNEPSAHAQIEGFDCDLTQSQLPTSLKFNRNTMSIFVKRTSGKMDDRPKSSINKTRHQNEYTENSENIVCSPNFNVDGSIDFDTTNQIQSSSNGHFEQSYFKARRTDANRYRRKYDSIDDDGGDGGEDDDDDVLLRPRAKRSDRLMELLQCRGDPMRNAVILRNPRGNQPRSYTTDALYTALMDVKNGESIYRASQIHGVPRKTLRNWMKRWHIKSVYPMPYQLKKAAEKKRNIIQQSETPTTSTTTTNPHELS